MSSILRIDELTNKDGSGPVKASLGLQLPNQSLGGNGNLDWYEEGIWTPVLSADTPGTLAVGYGWQAGQFVRIGKQVTASFRIDISSFTLGTATGLAKVLGLPYASSPNQYFFGACMFSGIDSGGAMTTLYMAGSYNYLYLFGSTDNASWAGTPISGVSATDAVGGTITYFTDN